MRTVRVLWAWIWKVRPVRLDRESCGESWRDAWMRGKTKDDVNFQVQVQSSVLVA